MAYWNRNGKELYYLAPNRAVMAVSVTTSPQVEFGKPRMLFSLSEATPIGPSAAGMSRDGERVVMAVPPPQLRQLTLLDRQGKSGGHRRTSGNLRPALAVTRWRARGDHEEQPPEWQRGHLDVRSGDRQRGPQITNDTPPDFAPVWSPDSKQVAYVSTRGSYSGIYRKAADGTGAEELLFRYTPGAGIALTDWSADGKFFTFFTLALLVVPLEPPVADPLKRKAIEWLEEEYDMILGRFSPDSRFLAYMSNEAKFDVMQVYVRPFDPSKPDEARAWSGRAGLDQ